MKTNQYGAKQVKIKFPHNSTSFDITLKHEISSKEEKQIGFREIRISLIRDCHAACHTCNFQSKYDCFDCNPGYFYTKYSSNAPTGLCNPCNEAIKYCEDCISKTQCIKCEGNLTLVDGQCGCQKNYMMVFGENGEKRCEYDDSKNPFKAMRTSRLLNKLLVPLKTCSLPQCYSYDTEKCKTVDTYKGRAELRKTQSPEVIHLVVKKNDNSYPHSFLSDGIVNQMAVITLIGIDNSNFTYTWHEITEDNEKNDLWIHELKFYYKVPITNNPILLIQWQNATYTMDDEYSTQVDLCSLKFEEPNSSIILYNYYQTTKKYKRLMQQQADTSQVASGLVYILALLSTIDNGGQCFRTITAMQMTYMLKFVNMTLPPNVEYQLKEENELIDFAMFNLEAKTMDRLELKERFYEWGISPFMLNNDGEVIFCLILFFLISWIFYLFNYLIEKSNSLEMIDKQELTGSDKFKNFCKKSWMNTKSLILWRFICCLYLMATVQLSLYSWSNLIFSTFTSSSAGCFNFFIAIFFKMFQFANYIFLYKILDQSRGIKNLDIIEDSNSEQIKQLKLQYEEEIGLRKRNQVYPVMDDQDAPLAALPQQQQQPQKAANAFTKFVKQPLSLMKMMRFSFLFREYKSNQRLYPLADILRYEIICFVVCVFYQHATLQITCIGILSVLYMLDIITNKPFIEKLKHATAMFNEVMIAQSICLLYYLRQVEEIKQAERLSVGKFIIMSSQFQRVGNSIALIAIILQTIYYHYYNIKRDLKEEVVQVNQVKKDEDRLHLIESNINWLVQKFSRSFDQTLATIERVKSRMESGQLLGKDQNTENENLTGDPQDMAKFTTAQLQQTTQFGQKTQQETNEEMLLDPKARKQNIGMKPSALQFSVKNLATKNEKKA